MTENVTEDPQLINSFADQTNSNTKPSFMPNVDQPSTQPVQAPQNTYQQSSVNQPPISQQPSEIKNKRSNKRKILLALIGLIIFSAIIIIFGPWAYYRYYTLAYEDSQYGFTIFDQRGWYSVPPREGVYYSLGTGENEDAPVISYFGASPVDNVPTTNRESFQKSCDETYRDVGKSNLSFSDISINNTTGFVCSFESTPENVNQVYVMQQYLLLNEGENPYDYLIAVSYPKNNPDEKLKVERIIYSFNVE